MLGTYTKQPVEVLDYDVDYADWLESGDYVVSATAVPSPAGLTIGMITVLSPRVKVWASGGVDGVTYKVTVTATTHDGRVKQDEFRIRVKDL